MERRLAVLAGAAALIALARVAPAAPKTAGAKAAFQAGLAAYQHADFAGAATSFATSYELEADPETLFAWAQAERKQAHCDKALPLYDKLLAGDLPEANAVAVRAARDECRALLAPDPTHTPDPHVIDATVLAPPMASQQPTLPITTVTVERSPIWYRDPIPLTATITGAVALGVGIGFLVAGQGAEAAAHDATTYGAFASDDARAQRDGRIGVIASVFGGVLVGTGVALWIVHRDATPTSTAHVVVSAGSVSVIGRF